ncbi:hypothetical protein BDC45DRAFT_501013 [Circinella umbellata]|nr:hypothetical protein BDC45DRAFT_501013 [Circinella umbellata]
MSKKKNATFVKRWQTIHSLITIISPSATKYFFFFASSSQAHHLPIMIIISQVIICKILFRV